MLRTITVLALLVPLVPSFVSAADEYPTADTVRMVATCMAELGAQNEENLITCSCKQDIFEAEMGFTEYEQASLYERYIGMPGKRGNLFRDSEAREGYAERLKAVRQKAQEACPLVRKVTREKVKD